MKQSDRRELIRRMYQTECIKVGGIWKLKSGLKSPIYVSFRHLPSIPEEGLFTHLAVELRNLIRSTGRYDFVLPVPAGAVPIAVHLAQGRGDRQPVLFYRPPKDHGLPGEIEGRYKAGQTAAIVEDTVSTGSSAADVIAAARRAGLQVVNVFSLVDRSTTKDPVFLELGCSLFSLFKIQEVIQELRRQRQIGEAHLEEVMAYLENPLGFADNADLAAVCR